jgi:hypothetical protein
MCHARGSDLETFTGPLALSMTGKGKAVVWWGAEPKPRKEPQINTDEHG